MRKEKGALVKPSTYLERRQQRKRAFSQEDEETLGRMEMAGLAYNLGGGRAAGTSGGDNQKGGGSNCLNQKVKAK